MARVTVRWCQCVRCSSALQSPNHALTALIITALMSFAGCANPSGSFSASPAGISSSTPTTTTSTIGSNSSGTTGGGTTTTTTVTASAVNSVTVSSPSLAAGSTLTATVTLNEVAPAGGAVVSLTSSNPGAASVPASVTIAANQTSGTFTVTAANVSSDTAVTIEAAYNNTLAGITVTLKAPTRPPRPATTITISLSPTSATMTAGTTQQFTATVSGSTSTAVTWTATAGTISSTGLFTAPNVSASTTVTVKATAQADTSATQTALVTVAPVVAPPPPSGSGYSGTGPVASWNAYLYLFTDNRYHQAIDIYNAKANYPVIGYSYFDPACTNLGDTFNDYWQPIGNGLWWFINQPNLVYVRWVWYSDFTTKQILQQTPCIDYSGAPKYN